ncbi:MAG: trypsin-like peptidase domain-containing protein [Verrucomicrobiota bacterium]
MRWACKLEIISGRHAGRTFIFDLFDTPKIAIGGDPRGEVPLPDEPQVSRKHLSLHRDPESDRLVMRDSSTSGTFIDGVKVRERSLVGTSLLMLGQNGPCVRISHHRAARSAAPADLRPAATSLAPSVRQPNPARASRLAAIAAVIVIASTGIYFLRRSAQAETATITAVTPGLESKMAAMAAELEQTKGKFQRGMMDLGEASDSVRKRVEAKKGDSDTFVEMARKSEKAVGIVRFAKGSATAFAIGPKVFATNSHVTDPVREALMEGSKCWIILNRSGGTVLEIVKAVSHPEYGSGRAGQTLTYDVGLLYTREAAPLWLPIAPASVLRKVDSGFAVSYIGFPAEQMINVNDSNPLATMKTGIVTSVSGWDLTDSGFNGNLLIRHDMGSAGGASGSPILDRGGRVIGIHNAGNYYFLKVDGEPLRIPNAAAISYAQRIDCLRDIWGDYPEGGDPR